MTVFTATHTWLVDGIALPVICDGGEIYDAAHYEALREGRPGVAQYEARDVDADGREEWAIYVGGNLSPSRLEPVADGKR